MCLKTHTFVTWPIYEWRDLFLCDTTHSCVTRRIHVWLVSFEPPSHSWCISSNGDKTHMNMNVYHSMETSHIWISNTLVFHMTSLLWAPKSLKMYIIQWRQVSHEYQCISFNGDKTLKMYIIQWRQVSHEYLILWCFTWLVSFEFSSRQAYGCCKVDSYTHLCIWVGYD